MIKVIKRDTEEIIQRKVWKRFEIQSERREGRRSGATYYAFQSIRRGSGKLQVEFIHQHTDGTCDKVELSLPKEEVSDLIEALKDLLSTE